MIITKYVKIHNQKLKYFYQNLGYDVSNKYTIIKTVDLSKNSHIKISVKCDICNNIKEITFYNYYKNTTGLTEEYCCSKKCAINKCKRRLQDKYGVDNIFQLESIKDKSKETLIDIYGVVHPMYSNKIVNKLINTNLIKYGFEYGLSSIEVNKKKENTNLIKYGFKTPLLNYDIKNKILKKSNLTKFIKNKQLYKEKYNIDILNYENGNYIIKCTHCNCIYTIEKTLLKNRICINTKLCTNCNPIGTHTSGLEIKLYNFIEDIYSNTILKNNRNIIKPYELDIYLPDLKLAFEFNGVYWHDEFHKDKNYHKMKTDLCLKQNIQLIHVYEDDWNFKQDIVKSIILNKLNKTENKIFARKTITKEIIDNDLVKDFLEKNNVQGFINSDIKIGLFYNNELVSLMVFKKIKNSYELLRFCNKLNTNIIGGVSKLFKYFIDNNNPIEVISYVDRGYFNGNLYKQLGFKLDSITDPNYYYVIEGIKKDKKDVLIKQEFDSNKSKHKNMLNRKIYNSGNFKFIYKI